MDVLVPSTNIPPPTSQLGNNINISKKALQCTVFLMHVYHSENDALPFTHNFFFAYSFIEKGK